jgi:hypothetical protein
LLFGLNLQHFTHKTKKKKNWNAPFFCVSCLQRIHVCKRESSSSLLIDWLIDCYLY